MITHCAYNNKVRQTHTDLVSVNAVAAAVAVSVSVSVLVSVAVFNIDALELKWIHTDIYIYM